MCVFVYVFPGHNIQQFATSPDQSSDFMDRLLFDLEPLTTI